MPAAAKTRKSKQAKKNSGLKLRGEFNLDNLQMLDAIMAPKPGDVWFDENGEPIIAVLGCQYISTLYPPKLLICDFRKGNEAESLAIFRQLVERNGDGSLLGEEEWDILSPSLADYCYNAVIDLLVEGRSMTEIVVEGLPFQFATSYGVRSKKDPVVNACRALVKFCQQQLGGYDIPSPCFQYRYNGLKLRWFDKEWLIQLDCLLKPRPGDVWFEPDGTPVAAVYAISRGHPHFGPDSRYVWVHFIGWRDLRSDYTIWHGLVEKRFDRKTVERLVFSQTRVMHLYEFSRYITTANIPYLGWTDMALGWARIGHGKTKSLPHLIDRYSKD